MPKQTKRERGKCEHGNTLIRIQGCAHCCVQAMAGFRLLRVFGDINHYHLAALLLKLYPDPKSLKDAAAEAHAEKPIDTDTHAAMGASDA